MKKIVSILCCCFVFAFMLMEQEDSTKRYRFTGLGEKKYVEYTE